MMKYPQKDIYRLKSLPQNKLPNFLVVGAGRSGTTFLDGLLRQHPDIYLPKVKESHFFDLRFHPDLEKEASFGNINQLEKKVEKLVTEEYADHFRDVHDEAAIGEITPCYMYYKWVPQLIHNFNSEIKLIFLLRNPIMRTYSHYWYDRMTLREHLSFEKAMSREGKRITESEYNRRHFSYLGRSNYMEQIHRFLNYFQRDQMLFLISEEFFANVAEGLEKICHFLNVDPVFEFNTKIYTHHTRIPKFPKWHRYLVSANKNLGNQRFFWRIGNLARYLRDRIPLVGNYPSMNPLTRQLLSDLFEPGILELEQFLGYSIDHWKD